MGGEKKVMVLGWMYRLRPVSSVGLPAAPTKLRVLASPLQRLSPIILLLAVLRSHGEGTVPAGADARGAEGPGPKGSIHAERN